MEKKNQLSKVSFSKDFILVIVGQIISLFGNQILRYALPLYLFNQTGSAFLFGLAAALSFIPMLLLAPTGGIIADRVNKRNVMVTLDFSTAGLMLLFSLIYQQLNITAVTIVALMLLFGIQGLYQPTVQASVPVLVEKESLMQGNAVINMVSSLAGILGPVIGGLAFSKFGLLPILIIAIICFTISAIIEIFIHIPYTRRTDSGSVLQIVKGDIRESLAFILKERKEIWKVSLLLLVINATFSALIIVGLPVVVNRTLGFEEQLANTLYGYAEGALALGGLVGGILAGVLGKRLKVQKGAVLLGACAGTLLPIALALYFSKNAYITYGITVVCCCLMMIFSTILSIVLITYVQIVTPENLLGKVMSLLTCLVMCGHPIGQLIYGSILDLLQESVYIVFSVVFVLAILISVVADRIFRKIDC